MPHHYLMFGLFRRGSRRPDPSDYPAFYRAYMASFRLPPPADEEQPRYVALDTETTGLDARRDQLLSIGAVRLVGNRILAGDIFSESVAVDAAGPQSSAATIAVHGISLTAHNRIAGRAEAILPAFLTYLGTAPIIAHHAGFDREVLNQALAKIGAGPLLNPWIDTVDLAKRIQPAGYWTPPQTYSLDTLADRYRVPLSDRHTALGDAYITAQLYLKLTSRKE